MSEEYTGTYSPDDNKLRLYAGGRLDHDLFIRVKEAGFRWAPKQELFVAPMWTPGREDLLMELCGEITDEDISLVDRAEERADRFEGYQESRAKDAKSAAAAVQDITNGIPMGQPILVGHHSEKRARKDADKITRGMERAVKMWETSQYWEYRAAGAIRHAKYKEKPAVRARRIKKIEASKRKQDRNVEHAEKCLKYWDNLDNDSLLKLKDGGIMTAWDRARVITNYFEHISCKFSLDKYPREEPASQYEGSMSLWSALDGIITAEQARDIATPTHNRNIKWADRWISHYNNRLIYEKTMLEAQGAGDLLKPKARPKQPPILNYKAAEGFIMIENRYRRGEINKYIQVEITRAQYKEIYADYKGTGTVERSHRVRTTMANCIPGYVDSLKVTGIDRSNASHSLVCIFLTDSKAHAKPEPVEPPKPDLEKKLAEVTARVEAKQEPDQDATLFDSLKESLKEGVKVAVAPQLFPTPPEIAEKMVEYADIEKTDTVMEPSAGTGNILQAIMNDDTAKAVLAVEINYDLVQGLIKKYPLTNVRHKDFLDYDRGQWPVDKVIMNPPFEKGIDIKHINHAFDMLAPGGRLVALCANGPRQRAAFMDMAEHWEDLPAGSFEQQGTGVNVALMVLTK